MVYANNWRRLMPLAVILLAGCATTPPAPIVAPCPEQPHPPASLKGPAESPATRQELDRRLKTTSPPAPATPNG